MARKIAIKLLCFAAVVTLGQLAVFYHYNHLFSAADQSVQSILSNHTKPESLSQTEQKEVAKLRSQYKFVTVSPDDQYATYIDKKNILHLYDLQQKRDISAAENPYTVQYVSWISDESVFVGEQVRPGNLELKTVNVDDGTQVIVEDFAELSPDAAFAKIAFSHYTNDVYILINTSTSSTIYHIDTMKHVDEVPIGGRYIKNIAVSDTENRLYFEDRLNGSYNVLYFDNNYVAHRVQLNAALISVVGNTVYYGDVNKDGYVTSVYSEDPDGTSHLIKTLATPTPASKLDVTDDGQVRVDA
ncbi:hypothetical protein [Alicyclobacillus acidoterrestris]|uniref:Uncharacterized protein n=1 Tax=Alicyclobacillus acidoterrestris (strain ATCC 49025 / DSM 3922 / CIP 106132 / NCIMB 13137 / GD3B) TaxID=1356854 RepID=T0CUM8_ALIAG|nr:hypothetical protein [Alicyclobacillus acidoterrestris]EPZ43057.1 hypothetical protein N007_01570 [Alicyclobacillus acidoterrestris ATCC 49025]UNO49849.1 hypothetical protein K1I37_04895 [Alicyclobacillus acidoterrestris]